MNNADNETQSSNSKSNPIESTPTVWMQISTLAAFRSLLYTGHRMVFPFLPIISRGLGVSLEMVALAVSFRSALGIFSPIIGSLIDNQGQKRSILMGLVIFCLSSLLIAVYPSYSSLIIGLSLFWIGIMLFDPASQAFIGHQVNYQHRARAMAVLGFGWSGAFLIGIPLTGWVMENNHWNTPFYWFAGFSIIGFLVIGKVLPDLNLRTNKKRKLTEDLRYIVSNKPTLAALLLIFLLVTANQTFLIVYGAWLEDSFNLTSSMLGNISVVIGVAGISGLITIALISDRLGIRKAIIIGIIFNIAATILLPLVEDSIAAAVLALFLYIYSIDFSLITGISLLTELRPLARATMMSFNTAALAAGDSLGAFLGSILYQGTIRENILLAVILKIAGLGILFFIIKDPASKPQDRTRIPDALI